MKRMMKPKQLHHAIFLLGILGLLTSGAQAEDSVQQREALRVEVNAVMVNVLVTDQKGIPISGLAKKNFRVFEDGVEQEISHFFPVDAPFSVALLLDTSYSTFGKLAQIQDSAIEFLEQIHPDDEVMVISFDDEVYLETEFTRHKDRAERAVKQTRTGQSTQLYEAVYLGLQELKEQPFRKVMVLFSDGVDTTSRASSAGETIQVTKEADVAIYTILFNTQSDMLRRPPSYPRTPGTIPGRNPGPLGIPGGSPLPAPLPSPRDRRQIEVDYQRARSYMSRLAEVSGGKRFEAAGNLHNLGAAFAQIAEEMRSLYSISYVSTNPKSDGKFRKIKVKVDLLKARVRAREGYSNPKGKS